mmetsp:Transcript_4551/g.20660  ORF Transcript_4551/g.20660 Transcript_4551/m.20660 type:complete len:236 (-) Transcript_4551:2060-2767(-)
MRSGSDSRSDSGSDSRSDSRSDFSRCSYATPSAARPRAGDGTRRGNARGERAGVRRGGRPQRRRRHRRAAPRDQGDERAKGDGTTREDAARDGSDASIPGVAVVGEPTHPLVRLPRRLARVCDDAARRLGLRNPDGVAAPRHPRGSRLARVGDVAEQHARHRGHLRRRGGRNDGGARVPRVQGGVQVSAAGAHGRVRVLQARGLGAVRLDVRRSNDERDGRRFDVGRRVRDGVAL